MTGTGYSQTPLVKKLDLKPGFKIKLINPPGNYFSLLQTDLSGQLCSGKEIPDWVHFFAPSQQALDKEMPRLVKLAKQNTQLIIWVSWYKRSSKIPTDLTDQIVRETAIRHGLVDIKVCSISEQWSGLKLVVPLSKR